MELEDYHRGLNLTANCSHIDISYLRGYNYASSITSLLTFFPTVCLLIVIFFYHSYSSILHRLFIYFTLSIMAYLVASATDLQLQFDVADTYCKWTGYTKMSAHTIALLFSSEICAYLLCKMYYQIRHHKKLPQVNRLKAFLLELGIVTMTVLPAPLLLLLARDRFGLSSSVCWVKIFQNGTCLPMENGTCRLILSLMIIKGSFYSFNFIAYSILIGLFCWLACTSEIARKQYFSTARRTVILVLLLLTTSGTDLITLFVWTYVVDKQKPVRGNVGWYFSSIYIAAVQCIQPIAYLFYLNSVKKFQWESTRSMARRWKSKGQSCCTKALKFLGNPFSTNSESAGLIQENSNVNLNNTPALTSSMSLYGARN